MDDGIEQQPYLVGGLITALYGRNDVDPDDSLLRELAEAKRSLRKLHRRRDAERAEGENGAAEPKKAMGVPLGPETTGPRVVTTIRLQPIPAGICYLLDPESDPLLTVTVKNESYEPRRVCVTAFIEGLSARSIKTIKLKSMDREGQTIPRLPSLIPEQARRITEVQRCILHVEVVDQDQKVESRDIYSAPQHHHPGPRARLRGLGKAARFGRLGLHRDESLRFP